MKTYKDAFDSLTSDQKEEIADAIAKAEEKTSGEIRVLVVAASSVVPQLTKSEQRMALRHRAEKEFVKLGIQNTREKDRGADNGVAGGADGAGSGRQRDQFRCS